MTEPLISIIIPCYNGERYIEQTLKSVLWQTYRRWECIVIDDGSTDRSSEIVKLYAAKDPRIRYHKKENGGLASARNAGIALAAGAYIQFLDADDLILNHRLERCIEHFRQRPECMAVYSDYILYHDSKGFYKYLPGKIPLDDQLEAFLFEFNRTFVIPIHSYLFRADIVKANYFDESLKSFAEDNEYRIRLAVQKVKFEFIDEVLALYRMNDLQVTTKDEAKIFVNMLNVLDEYQNHPACSRYAARIKEHRLYLHQRIAIGYFMMKQFRLGISELRLVRKQLHWPALLKAALWGVLMLFISKDLVAQGRSAVSKLTGIKIQGWNEYSDWTAPEYLLEALHQ